MTLLEMKQAIENGVYDEKFVYLYGKGQQKAAAERYLTAIDEFAAFYGYTEGDFYAFSAPGRTELCGNHTDHNYGKVLAGAVNIDVIAIHAHVHVARKFVELLLNFGGRELVGA